MHGANVPTSQSLVHLPDCTSTECTCEPDVYGHMPSCALVGCICGPLITYGNLRFAEGIATARAAVAAAPVWDGVRPAKTVALDAIDAITSAALGTLPEA